MVGCGCKAVWEAAMDYELTELTMYMLSQKLARLIEASRLRRTFTQYQSEQQPRYQSLDMCYMHRINSPHLKLFLQLQIRRFEVLHKTLPLRAFDASRSSPTNLLVNPAFVILKSVCRDALHGSSVQDVSFAFKFVMICPPSSSSLDQR